MMIKFQPFGENVVVKAPKVEEKTSAGIFKPDSILKEEKDKVDIYLEVIAVGEKVTTINIGDKVLIQGGSHRSIVIDDTQCLVVYYGMIIGKKL